MSEQLPLHLSELLALWQQPQVLSDRGFIQVEGAEGVRWLLRSSLEICAIVGKDSALLSLQPEIRPWRDRGRVHSCSKASLAQALGFSFDRGVVALAQRPTVASDAWRTVVATPSRSGILLCDHIHDPANLGTMLRSARCLGLGAALLGPGCADPWSRRCIRTGVGHPLLFPHYPCPDLGAALAALRQEGTTIIAAHRGPRSQDLQQPLPAMGHWALVLGNEDRGIDPQLLTACPIHRHIPMAADCDSLNVGAAAAIFMHHCAAVSAVLLDQAAGQPR